MNEGKVRFYKFYFIISNDVSIYSFFCEIIVSKKE